MTLLNLFGLLLVLAFAARCAEAGYTNVKHSIIPDMLGTDPSKRKSATEFMQMMVWARKQDATQLVNDYRILQKHQPNWEDNKPKRRPGESAFSYYYRWFKRADPAILAKHRPFTPPPSTKAPDTVEELQQEKEKEEKIDEREKSNNGVGAATGKQNDVSQQGPDGNEKQKQTETKNNEATTKNREVSKHSGNTPDTGEQPKNGNKKQKQTETKNNEATMKNGEVPKHSGNTLDTGEQPKNGNKKQKQTETKNNEATTMNGEVPKTKPEYSGNTPDTGEQPKNGNGNKKTKNEEKTQEQTNDFVQTEDKTKTDTQQSAAGQQASETENPEDPGKEPFSTKNEKNNEDKMKGNNGKKNGEKREKQKSDKKDRQMNDFVQTEEKTKTDTQQSAADQQASESENPEDPGKEPFSTKNEKNNEHKTKGNNGNKNGGKHWHWRASKREVHEEKIEKQKSEKKDRKFHENNGMKWERKHKVKTPSEDDLKSWKYGSNKEPERQGDGKSAEDVVIATEVKNVEKSTDTKSDSAMPPTPDQGDPIAWHQMAQMEHDPAIAAKQRAKRYTDKLTRMKQHHWQTQMKELKKSLAEMKLDKRG